MPLQNSSPWKASFKCHHILIEPFDVSKHSEDLINIFLSFDATQKFRYLFQDPFKTRQEALEHLKNRELRQDAFYYAIIDKASNKLVGNAGLNGTAQEHRTTQLGLYFGDDLCRKSGATEAVYLLLKFIFEGLKFRRLGMRFNKLFRLVWKCDNRNRASKNSGVRAEFVYEALFRHLGSYKNEIKDECFYSMIDKDWRLVKEAFEKWLGERNFDEDKRQKEKLEDIRKKMEEGRNG